MIPYTDPSLWYGSTTHKSLVVTDGTLTVSGTSYTITGDTVTITTPDFESEAFEFHQSINSDMQLRFGSCESAYIAFVIRKSGISSLIGKVLKVYIIPNHDASKILQLGVFKVQTDKLSYDGTRRSVSAYDAMYDVLNSDVADWYNTELPDDSTTTTVGALAQSFLTHFGLTLDGTISGDLPNSEKVIRRTIDSEQISGADIIRAICEINGVFGRINNTGAFQFKKLVSNIRPSSYAWEVPVSDYMDIQFDDYDSKDIDGLRIITDEASITVGFNNPPTNIYTISGNCLIADYDRTLLPDLAQRLKGKFYNHYYTACTVNALGNPVLEPGDAIKIITKNGATYTYILERHMRGIQALRDTYTAHGEEYSTESLNTISNRYNRVNSSVSQAISQSVVSGDSNFVEVIRNIGFRLLDEPSNTSLVFKSDNTIELKWTDPSDISSSEPVPATWAGTVVVRKEGSAPLHRWDGTLLVNSTTRNQYQSNPLVDSNLSGDKTYFYGIFPYDTKGDYRYTKVLTSGNVVNDDFTWLYDGSKPAGEQFPYGMVYDIGTISSTYIALPTIESSYIDMPKNGYIIFEKKLKKCSTVKMLVMRTGTVEPGAVNDIHLVLGDSIAYYVSNPPNHGNQTGYDVFDESVKRDMEFYYDDVTPINTQVTLTHTMLYNDTDMYVFLPVSYACRIYKIWGE